MYIVKKYEHRISSRMQLTFCKDMHFGQSYTFNNRIEFDLKKSIHW